MTFYLDRSYSEVVENGFKQFRINGEANEFLKFIGILSDSLLFILSTIFLLRESTRKSSQLCTRNLKNDKVITFKAFFKIKRSNKTLGNIIYRKCKVLEFPNSWWWKRNSEKYKLIILFSFCLCTIATENLHNMKILNFLSINSKFMGLHTKEKFIFKYITKSWNF